MNERSRLSVVVGGALMASVVLFFTIPTLFLWSAGGLRPRTLFSATSPDGAYHVEGVVQIDLPVLDILDPSGMLRVTLTDTRTGKDLDQLLIGLYEAGDFQPPTIVWESTGRVHLHDLERGGHRLSATLDRRQWDRRE